MILSYQPRFFPIFIFHPTNHSLLFSLNFIWFLMIYFGYALIIRSKSWFFCRFCRSPIKSIFFQSQSINIKIINNYFHPKFLKQGSYLEGNFLMGEFVYFSSLFFFMLFSLDLIYYTSFWSLFVLFYLSLVFQDLQEDYEKSKQARLSNNTRPTNFLEFYAVRSGIAVPHLFKG